MLSSAIIVFREAFEIVLIVGIVLAATRDVPGRNKAIYGGFAAGILGSIGVAFSIGKISDMAEGMGQEYFNAGILFVAAAFIGWTLLWMQRHSRDMKNHFEKVGNAVTDGKLPYFSLFLIITLAILREGSEIALFSYGMLAAGQSATSIAIGSTLGMIGGLSVGLLLYMGLIKLSLKVFFQVTSSLLILLVAGMMSQGIGLLSATGAFENLSYIVWDSSWLLNEGSVVGQTLSALIGYTSRPTAIQLIFYTLTFGFLIVMINLSNIKAITKSTS